MSFLLAAISLGFLGSFHCIGMCGPIALALPLGSDNMPKRISGSVVYNLGRIFTYGIFGLLFGAIGKGFVIGGYQQALSIALGSVILFYLFLPAQATSSFPLTKVILPFVAKVKSLLSKLFHEKGFASLFLIGVLNGLLPCGLVYLGVAGAIATGDVLNGSLFMMAFGAGTLPGMLLISLSSNLISVRWGSTIRKAVPVFAGIMACILILRGMSLGIPYVSPEMSKNKYTIQSCCHKK